MSTDFTSLRGPYEDLVEFLIARLTEDLAMVWSREESRDLRLTGPGMSAQVAIIDEMLTTLHAGLLPTGQELRMLLYGYGAHPDYDPTWTSTLYEASAPFTQVR